MSGVDDSILEPIFGVSPKKEWEDFCRKKKQKKLRRKRQPLTLRRRHKL